MAYSPPRLISLVQGKVDFKTRYAAVVASLLYVREA